MKCVIVFTSLIACALAAPRPFDPRITGGKDATAGQFPYQVSLEWGILGINQHVCGGSIINEQWILTAGHCITELPMPGDMAIVAGILKLNDQKGAQKIEVVERIVHPDYNGGVNPNDIALLKLKTPLTFNDKVQPIKLPSANAEPTGESVLSGWGSTSTSSWPIMPNTLQTVNLPILSDSECADAFRALMGTSEPLDAVSNVCTGPLTGGLSACSGDSGGPLAQNGEVIGVVSWGMMPCGTKGAPSVYTQVSNFRDFIDANVK